MYKNQFDKELNQPLHYSAYMFYGDCDYYIESYATKVAQLISQGEEISKVYFDEYNFKDCENFLLQSSLFSATNILLIKTLKKIPKKEVDALIAACNSNENSKVIFTCIGDTDFKTMAKSFTKKSNSVEVRFFSPNDNEALNILNQEIKKRSLQCTPGELQYLYNMHQKDLSLCVNDLDKLSLLNEPITISMINAQCFGMGAVNVEDFLSKLLSGQNINRDLYMLLEEGMNEIQLINQTISFIQLLFNINTYVKLYGKLDIIEIWGYNCPKHIANQKANIAVKYHQKHFLKMLEFFQNVELNLKTKTNLEVNSYLQACFRNFSASLR
jgi:DNA polymerase-3 subunit delta